MNNKNLIGIIIVAIFIIAIFAYVDFFAKPLPDASQNSTSTSDVINNATSTPSPIEYFPNGTFTMKLNESKKILNSTITPWAVLEDSRCPDKVQCIQAGRVVVGVRIDSIENDVDVESTMEMKPGDTFSTPGFILTLKDVTPYPTAGIKTSDDQYLFIFSATSR